MAMLSNQRVSIYSSQDSSIAAAIVGVIENGRPEMRPEWTTRNSEVFKAQVQAILAVRTKLSCFIHQHLEGETGWQLCHELLRNCQRPQPPSLNSTSGKEPLWSSTASARSETRDRRASLSMAGTTRQKSSFKWWICSWIVVSKVDAFYCHISELDPMALHGSSMRKK